MFKQLFWLGLILATLVFGSIGYRKWDQFTLWLAVKKPPPAWAERQIERDLKDFSGGITQEALNATLEKIQAHEIPVYRYRIINNQIYRTPTDDGLLRRAYTFDKMLKRLARSVDLPNLDFLLCLMDGVPEFYVPEDFWITDPQAPLLTWARKEGAPHLLLIPDFLTTRESGWHRDIVAINKKHHATPWHKREARAFWRGATNDKGYTLTNYLEKPRFLASRLSLERPDLINARFNNAFPDPIRSLFSELDLLSPTASLTEQIDYKYLPVIDGYTCTYPGFQWRLLSGSVPFKQESPDVQYFYSALKPFIHYIPIKHDMSDLADQIAWAQQHDDAAHRIATNARDFAEKNLMPDQIYSYLYWALKKYASLQTFHRLEKDPSWKQVH